MLLSDASVDQSDIVLSILAVAIVVHHEGGQVELSHSGEEWLKLHVALCTRLVVGGVGVVSMGIEAI